MSRSRRKQPRHHGLLLVDKPAGVTSHDVVAAVRRIYGQQKVGHAGTLDPLATGLLPLLLGEGTKLSAWATADDKTYETTAHLGVRTDTLDAEGATVDQAPVPTDLDDVRVEEALAGLRGDIEQRVPAYSAVKVDGRKLYERARAGEEMELPTRRVRIHELRLLDLAPPKLTLRVACSKGTYIRQLVADLGDALGCGAHVAALRRTRVGSLDVADAVDLAALEAADHPAAHLIAPRDFITRFTPCVTLDAEGATRTRMGQRLSWAQLGVDPLPPATRFALVTEEELIALAESPPAEPSSPRFAYRLVRVFPAATQQ